MKEIKDIVKTYSARVENALTQDYDHEVPDKLRSVTYNHIITLMLKQMFPDCRIIPSKGGWCTASGFIKGENRTVYYSFSDYRYSDWKQRILIRTAADEHDYTGGGNHYTNVERMHDDVALLMR